MFIVYSYMFRLTRVISRLELYRVFQDFRA